MPRTVMRSSVLAGVVILALLALGAGTSGARGAAKPTAAANAYTVTPLVADQSGEAPTGTAPGERLGPGGGPDLAVVGGEQRNEHVHAVPRRRLERRAGRPRGRRADRHGVQRRAELRRHRRHEQRAVGLPVRHRERPIRGWNPGVPPPPPSTKAFAVVNRQHVEAEYKGLAIASTDDGDFLYATDFHNRRVDVFDGEFNLVTTRAFRDPDISEQVRAPFGSRTSAGTSSSRTPRSARGGDDVSGHGHGFVDEYDAMGNLIARVATHGALNSPWGLAMAPDDFGRFSGDLLVGNFGNGKVNAYSWSGGTWQRDGKLRWRTASRGDRRPVGDRVRQRQRLGPDQLAVLHGRSGRREPRALRNHHGRQLERRRAQSGLREAPGGRLSAASRRLHRRARTAGLCFADERAHVGAVARRARARAVTGGAMTASW